MFAVHRKMINNIADHFGCNKIDGTVSIEDRQKYVDDFQTNENTKLIILNINAGGVGITLTAAHHLAFLELGWTPGEIRQAEDRIHRIGQKNIATIYFLLGDKTIDQDIYSLIMNKEVVTDGVNKGQFEKESKILLFFLYFF